MIHFDSSLAFVQYTVSSETEYEQLDEQQYDSTMWYMTEKLDSPEYKGALRSTSTSLGITNVKTR